MSEREGIIFGAADLGFTEFQAVADSNGITITIEEPFAGDTETGFGRSCSIRLSLECAITLSEWLADAVTTAV